MCLSHFQKHLDPVFLWHNDVGDDQVDFICAHSVQGFVAIARAIDLMALDSQHFDKNLTNGAIVVNNQNVCHDFDLRVAKVSTNALTRSSRI